MIYEVGYEDEMIGVYAGDTPEEAIAACKEHMKATNFIPDTTADARLNKMFAVQPRQ